MTLFLIANAVLNFGLAYWAGWLGWLTAPLVLQHILPCVSFRCIIDAKRILFLMKSNFFGQKTKTVQYQMSLISEQKRECVSCSKMN